MSGSDPESGEGTGGVEEDDEDPYQRGGKAEGVRIFIQIHCSVVVALQCIDVGGYPLPWDGS